MIVMDCDRARGEFINSKEGTSMAERKINSIEKISSQLHKLDLPRTFSICGSFLESMSLKFGKERMADAFNVKDDNVEIADHGYSHNIVKFFLKKNVKAIVIACNTVSSVAYSTLCKNYSIPFFDVVTPSVMLSNKFSINRKVGVIGTYATINSKAYTNVFKKINSDCSIVEVSCPLLVPLIEEGWENKEEAKKIAEFYLNPFINSKIDSLILGCTHYPIMLKVIKDILKNKIELVESGVAVANKLLKYLDLNKIQNDSKKKSKTEFFVTDYPHKFDELGSRFLGRSLENIKLISLI